MRIERDATDGGIKVLLNVSLRGEGWVLITRFAREDDMAMTKALAIQPALVSAMEAEVIAYKEALTGARERIHR